MISCHYHGFCCFLHGTGQAGQGTGKQKARPGSSPDGQPSSLQQSSYQVPVPQCQYNMESKISIH